MMPFTFCNLSKKYKIISVKGSEEVCVFLKKLGIIPGNNIRPISSNGSGFIVTINGDSRFALDRKLANKIMVEEE